MDQRGFKKNKRIRPYFQLPNYKFKILLYVNFFRNLVQYSPLSSASWVDGQKKKKMSWWIRLLRILCLGGK